MEQISGPALSTKVAGVQPQPQKRLYSKSHFKCVTFALHSFRLLLTPFLSDCHQIWQALFFLVLWQLP